ncbi:MAG: fibronectin type III domain-containing protein [Syntrophomonadaceae bacterium]|nr:fibronectin type III domain-containing protein [Syntrophomonadaceae bacterium]
MVVMNSRGSQNRLLLVAIMVSLLLFGAMSMAQASGTPLHDAAPGTIINFSGKQWIVLEHMANGETYIILKDSDGFRPFDPDNTDVFDPNDSDNIAYYLNNTFYGGLSQKEFVSNHSWTRVAYDGGDAIDDGNITCKVGLLSYREYQSYSSYYDGDVLPSGYSNPWWTRTRSQTDEYTLNGVWIVLHSGRLFKGVAEDTTVVVHPTLFLQSGLVLDENNDVSLAPPPGGGDDTMLRDQEPGTIINFSGREWIILEHMANGETYLILKESDGERAFDPDNTKLFDPNDSNNIAYYLNNTFYGGLSQKEFVSNHSWDRISYLFSDDYDYGNITCKVGLLSVNEYRRYLTAGIFPGVYSFPWWLRTPGSPEYEGAWFVNNNGNLARRDSIRDDVGVRPTIYLKAGLALDPDNNIIDGNTSTPPAAPIGLTAVATSPTTVNLNWNANTEQDLAGYKVYRNGVVIASVGKVTSWTDITASPGTTYTYELVAYNATGQDSGRSNPATVSTPPLTSPTALKAVWKGDYIEVSWEAGDTLLGNQAALWRQMDNGSWIAIKTLKPMEKESFVLNDRNVGVGVNCRYEIQECSVENFFGWTVVEESGWATGDRPLAAPGGLRILSSSDNAVITWNPVTGASSYVVHTSVDGQTWQTQAVSATSASVPRPSQVRVKAEGTYSHWSGALTVR